MLRRSLQTGLSAQNKEINRHTIATQRKVAQTGGADLIAKNKSEHGGHNRAKGRKDQRVEKRWKQVQRVEIRTKKGGIKGQKRVELRAKKREELRAKKSGNKGQRVELKKVQNVKMMQKMV